MTPEQWAVIATALGAGAVGQHRVGLLADRVRGRMAARQRQQRAADDLRADRNRWIEAAWATRHAAVRAGIAADQLPDLPDDSEEEPNA